MAEGQEIIICHSSYSDPMQVPWPVAKCSKYWDVKKSQDLDELKAIAWIITPNRERSVGFMSPKELSKMDEEKRDKLIGPLERD